MEDRKLLEIREMNKSYYMGNNRIEVLKELSLELGSGESIAIIGDSGIGKSTLLNIIGTIDKPDSGYYKFSGEDVLSLNDEKLSFFRNKNIGFVFQAMYLLQEFTALENIMIPALISKIPKKEAMIMADKLLRDFNIQSRANHRPSELSGGERQRVAIARAIINKPKLILADEPTGNLDEKNADMVIEILRNLNKEYDLSILLVSHNNHLAKKMNIVYRLEKGKLIKI